MLRRARGTTRASRRSVLPRSGSPETATQRSAWTARFGDDAAALGRSLTVDGAPATVIGVIPDRSGFPSTFAIWRPLRQTPGLAAEARDQRTLQVFGRVADGARIDDARAEINAI